MLADPMSVTYNSSGKSLARVSNGGSQSVYRTADGEFEVSISYSPTKDGLSRYEVLMTRITPDPSPANVFDNYRKIPNRFGLVYEVDPDGFFSSDVPLLRTALLALVDTTLQGRILAGEK